MGGHGDDNQNCHAMGKTALNNLVGNKYSKQPQLPFGINCFLFSFFNHILAILPCSFHFLPKTM